MPNYNINPISLSGKHWVLAKKGILLPPLREAGISVSAGHFVLSAKPTADIATTLPIEISVGHFALSAAQTGNTAPPIYLSAGHFELSAELIANRLSTLSIGHFTLATQVHASVSAIAIKDVGHFSLSSHLAADATSSLHADITLPAFDVSSNCKYGTNIILGFDQRLRHPFEVEAQCLNTLTADIQLKLTVQSSFSPVLSANITLPKLSVTSNTNYGDVELPEFEVDSKLYITNTLTSDIQLPKPAVNETFRRADITLAAPVVDSRANGSVHADIELSKPVLSSFTGRIELRPFVSDGILKEHDAHLIELPRLEMRATFSVPVDITLPRLTVDSSFVEPANVVWGSSTLSKPTVYSGPGTYGLLTLKRFSVTSDASKENLLTGAVVIPKITTDGGMIDQVLNASIALPSVGVEAIANEASILCEVTLGELNINSIVQQDIHVTITLKKMTMAGELKSDHHAYADIILKQVTANAYCYWNDMASDTEINLHSFRVESGNRQMTFEYIIQYENERRLCVESEAGPETQFVLGYNKPYIFGQMHMPQVKT